jgi:hypothetical protein
MAHERTRGVQGRAFEPASDGGDRPEPGPARADQGVLAVLLDELADRIAARLQPQSVPPPTSTTTAALVTKQHLATLLGCSTATVDRLVREDRIPYFVVGDARRFDFVEVCDALRTERSSRISACGTAALLSSAAAQPPVDRGTDGVTWSRRRDVRRRDRG